MDSAAQRSAAALTPQRALVAGSQEMAYFPLIGQKCNGPKGPGTWPDAAIVTPKSDKFCGVDAP